MDAVESRTLPAGCMDGHSSPKIIRPQKYSTKYRIKIIIYLYLLLGISP
jgi:hypothetical protein